ncbi:hypothetical protein ES703_38656 [subsurface metagenome]
MVASAKSIRARHCNKRALTFSPPLLKLYEQDARKVSEKIEDLLKRQKPSAWEADILPLNYARKNSHSSFRNKSIQSAPLLSRSLFAAHSIFGHFELCRGQRTHTDGLSLGLIFLLGKPIVHYSISP